MEEGTVHAGVLIKAVTQTYTYSTGDWKDLLESVTTDGTTCNILYDGSGNPTTYGNWGFIWQNGRQLFEAQADTDTTHTGLSYAYDAEGIRTGKTCTVETWEAIPQYTVTFVADGTTVKTMTVDDGYVLQSSDYPTVPPKTGYTGTWNSYTSAIHSNITIQATYTVAPTYTVTFVARGFTVKTMTVDDGYVLQDSDYPDVPPRLGYTGSWSIYTSPIHSNITITAIYRQGGGIEIPIDPTDPPVIMSLEDEDDAAASVGEQETPAEVQETAALSGDRTGQRLVSTQTVQHDYLTLGGRVARETITTDGTVTAVLDFIYDSQGRSCCNSGSVVACAARSPIALLLPLARLP